MQSVLDQDVAKQIELLAEPRQVVGAGVEHFWDVLNDEDRARVHLQIPKHATASGT